MQLAICTFQSYPRFHQVESGFVIPSAKYSHLVHVTIVVSAYVAQLHGKFSDLIAIHFFTRHCIYNNGTEYNAEE
jgi:hypothetical protein